ncbi:MAG: lysophospholipid acyltransferase family protein [Bacteroidales bacterium]
MKKIGFFFFLVFDKLVSFLPFKILYLISDFVYFILYYLIKYRKVIILENLKNAFPEKSYIEINLLRKKYMKIMADLIIESIKSAHLTKDSILKRFTLKNIDLLNELFEKKKNVFLVCGHTGSWELSGMILPLITQYKCFGIYQPQTNPFFDTYMKKIRCSFGILPLPSNQAYKKFIQHRNETILSFIVADQAPSRNGDHHWTLFLNQETAFFTGLEKMSKSLDFSVVFLRIIRTERGKYTLEFELLTEHPQETNKGEISEMYANALEKLIRQYPENWLWSHRRWKHQRN